MGWIGKSLILIERIGPFLRQKRLVLVGNRQMKYCHFYLYIRFEQDFELHFGQQSFELGR